VLLVEPDESKAFFSSAAVSGSEASVTFSAISFNFLVSLFFFALVTCKGNIGCELGCVESTTKFLTVNLTKILTCSSEAAAGLLLMIDINARCFSAAALGLSSWKLFSLTFDFSFFNFLICVRMVLSLPKTK
jgi:hypothetical protein